MMTSRMLFSSAIELIYGDSVPKNDVKGVSACHYLGVVGFDDVAVEFTGAPHQKEI